MDASEPPELVRKKFLHELRTRYNATILHSDTRYRPSSEIYSILTFALLLTFDFFLFQNASYGTCRPLRRMSAHGASTKATS